MPESLIARLREATRKAHTDLENTTQLPYALHNTDDLRRSLTQLLGFYRPLDKTLSCVALETNFTLPYAIVKRSSLLKSDLLSLGLSDQCVSDLPDCQHVPEFRTYHQLLGVHYVIEGSTLGGRVLQRHIDNHFPVAQQPLNMRYFNAYGEHSARHWQTFKHWANGLSLNEQQIACAITSATDLFETLNAWYRTSLASARETSRR